MKLLIDNNLSFKLADALQRVFPGTRHVSTALSVFAEDLNVWNFAKTDGYTILTKDNDFDELSQILGCPPKVIHLICGNTGTQHILNLVNSKHR